MLTRSTGLGRTELQGDVETLDVIEDYVIIGMKTTDPVKWHVRVALNFSDFLMMGRLILLSRKGNYFFVKQVFKFITRPFRKNKGYVRPDDY